MKNFSGHCFAALIVLVLFALCMLCGCSAECPHLRMATTTVAPDCANEGYTLNICRDCGYEYKSNFTAPTGHTLRRHTVLPTCSSEGHTDYICACGYEYTSDIVAPLGHEWITQTCEPTCCTQGYTLYTCSHCALNYKSDWTVPRGHTFSVTETNPTTCAVTGYREYTCSVCSYSYVGDFTFYSDIFDGAYSASTTPLACGLDVSKYQHETDEDGNYLPLDFDAIREAGFDFVILKAGSTPRTDADGSAKGGPEPTFEEDFTAAKLAGLQVGVYFYTYSATTEECVRDAELLIDWLDGKQLEYPVYFDIEDSAIGTMERRDITDLCVTFISTLQANRYFGALYTNNNWLMNHLQTDKVTFLFDIWYARYPDNNTFVWNVNRQPYTWNADKYGANVGMWQYTQSGKILTVSDTATFDFNYAYKDYPTIIKSLGYNGY